MNPEKEYFSKEYQQSNQTSGTTEADKNLYLENKTEGTAAPYKTGRPRRIPIRASIIHDQSN
jgi:hypothetical protein